MSEVNYTIHNDKSQDQVSGHHDTCVTGRPRYERITEWLTYLVDPDTVIELRAPEVDFGNDFKATVSGFYDSSHLFEMAVEAVSLTEAAQGVYFTINPLDPELLALRCNRAEKRPRRTAKDEDVIRRTRLLVDLDPTRYSKTTGRPLTGDFSATAAEKTRARATAERVRGDLEATGWPEPVFIDSGNGFYLLYKVDLPTDDGGLVERCLKALAAQYDDAGAAIDPRVFNPSRIMKVPGTSSRKGDSAPDRPHRRSKVITLPRSFEAVPTELLEALGSLAPVSKSGSYPGKSAPADTNKSRMVGSKYDQEITRVKRGQSTGISSSITDRARAYLQKLPPSVSGDHGHNALFRVAMVLVDGFGLDYDDAMTLLQEYNERQDGDPESDRQLEHKLTDALGKVAEEGGPSNKLNNITTPNDYYNTPSTSTGCGVQKEEDNADSDAQRPPILVNSDLHTILEDILALLPGDPDLYSRGHILVRFVQIETKDHKLQEGVTLRTAKGTYVLSPIDESSFLCRLAAMAYFYKEKRTLKGIVEVPCDPPLTPARAALNNAAYPGVRSIQGVVEAPYLLPGGHLVAPGYNQTTEIVYVPTVTFDPLPEHPTQADAKAAADRILTYVKEFPFASDADKAVWLAGVLTAVARPAIAGAAPGFALIGNRAGVGKGMLVHIAGIIATGRPIPSTSYPKDADEARKVKVTLALSGVQLVLLDDLDEGASYGNGPLDSVITENTMNERLLGVNKPTGEIKLRPTWWLTGNNVVPGRDAHRRWLVCNIVSDLEHPEERVVEIENLLEHIYKDRGTLLRDVLIILKAHAINGYKNNWKAKLGSFYEWDTIVRGAVWYATGQDCNQTRREAAAESPEYLRKLALLDQLENVQTLTIDGKQSYANGFTIDNLLSLASETDGTMGHNFRYTYSDLRNALMKFAKEGLPSAQSLGNIIAKLNKVLLEGKMIVKSGKDHHAIIWQVIKVQSQPTTQLE